MNFNKDQFYVVRAEKAGVFLCKILSTEGSTFQVSSFRRLYYWSGALDISQIASVGVNPKNCKFSVQLSDNDVSTIFNIVEVHPVSDLSLKSINSVTAWKQQ